jgi:uncharacterized protein (DUF924 family)
MRSVRIGSNYTLQHQCPPSSNPRVEQQNGENTSQTARRACVPTRRSGDGVQHGHKLKTENVEPTWVGEVIYFWFEELKEAHWFTKSENIDAQIRDRYLPLHNRLVANGALGIAAPRSILAAVIVLDQFSRNLYRGNPIAFSADPIERQLSRTAIEQAFDVAMRKEERLFLYLPFEHSENREDQALALNLIKHLGNEERTRDAMGHKSIIDRFGRFPHRNAVLNRVSTADEIAYGAIPAHPI